MRRTMVVVALVVATGIAAFPAPAAIGADSNKVSVNDLEAVPKAMAKAGSVHFAGRVTVTLSGTQSYYEYQVEGVRDLARNRAAWTVTVMSGAGEKLQFVSVGDTTYMSANGVSGTLPPALQGKQWIRFPRGTGGTPGDISGPRRDLAFAALPGLEYTKLGATRLNGVATKRVHLQWPTELPAVLLTNGATLPAKAEIQRVDLWLDSQDRLRRELSILVTREGRATVSVRALTDYSAYGRRVRVAVPDADDVGDANALDPSALPVV